MKDSCPVINGFDLNVLPSDEESPIEKEMNDNQETPSQTGGSILFDLNKTLDTDIHTDEEDAWVIETSTHTQQENRETEFYSLDLNQSLHLDSEGEVSEEVTQKKKRKFLSNDQRHQIYMALLQRSFNGKLKKYTTADVSAVFSVPRRTVQRIWKQSKNNSSSGQVDISHHKTKNCGRKRIQLDVEKFRKIPLSLRSTFQSMSKEMGMSKSTLHRNYKMGKLRRHSSEIRPGLKDGNKRARVLFCMSMLEDNSSVQNPKFVDMYNMVRIDEKWFNITKKSQKYYLLADEDEPHRTCQSKNFIGKIMFLAAIARPRFDEQGNEDFSGKIGIFPFITREPAKRSSANRPAGTLETKPITSVGRDLSRSFLIDKVLPAIRAKWPRRDVGKPIFIQQDNARTHVDTQDPEFCQAASEEGFDIRLTCQPPNSPDLNVLDLGFFSAIQSLHEKEPAKTLDELIFAVEKAFDSFSTTKSNRIFLTLQSCMVEIMKLKGDNKYKIPHMKKSALEKEGQLPCQLECDAKLVQDVLEWLN